jgi:hypothetical protein
MEQRTHQAILTKLCVSCDLLVLILKQERICCVKD